jgi:hypothetical protein
MPDNSESETQTSTTEDQKKASDKESAASKDDDINKENADKEKENKKGKRVLVEQHEVLFLSESGHVWRVNPSSITRQKNKNCRARQKVAKLPAGDSLKNISYAVSLVEKKIPKKKIVKTEGDGTLGRTPKKGPAADPDAVMETISEGSNE